MTPKKNRLPIYIYIYYYYKPGGAERVIIIIIIYYNIGVEPTFFFYDSDFNESD